MNTRRFDYADTLAQQVRALKLPAAVREYRFHPMRKWRFDLAWPEIRLFIECDGGEYIAGAHNRGAGMQGDCRKWNAAAQLGWIGFRFTGSMVRNGEAIAQLKEHFDDPDFRCLMSQRSTIEWCDDVI